MALVLAASFVGSFGAVFLKSGSEKLRKGLRHILNVRLAMGVGMYLLSSVFFIVAIRNGELSVLYPLVSLGYVWTLVWSRLFFREPFTRFKLVGLVMILAGVCFVGLGNR
ncbi:MAG: EamA family transporter [Candidatus Solibacter usitatus]|nr:EamA family transporter [Candidatus Solibacter usitatus]